MKFGKVDHPEHIDFTIPPDHPDTPVVLSKIRRVRTLKFLSAVPNGIGKNSRIFTLEAQKMS